MGGTTPIRHPLQTRPSAPLEQANQSHYRLKLEAGAVTTTSPAPIPKQRARRGSVGVLVSRSLKEHPGLLAGEIGEHVVALDSRVSPSSVNNELRRYEGSRYKREG